MADYIVVPLDKGLQPPFVVSFRCMGLTNAPLDEQESRETLKNVVLLGLVGTVLICLANHRHRRRGR